MVSDDVADLTVSILREIRDEVRKTNQRLDQTNERLDQTNERLDQTNERLERLERRQTETEVRLATELVAVASAVGELTELLRQDRALRQRVDDHERRISAVEQKVG
jgi:chromosome segregation ATPase